MELHVAPGFDAEGLELLVTAHPYNDYRHYRTISKDVQLRLLSSEIERAAEQGQVLSLRVEERVVGLATLSHLPWDSSIFGLPMAKIGHLIATSAHGSRAQFLDRLLEELIELARTQGIRHLSTRVDCADIEAIQCLEHWGFRLMECLITYIFRPKQDILPPIKTLYHVRPYTPVDREALLAIAERMYAHHQSRFSVDPSLPPAGVGRFYIEWTKNACSGEMADHILVAERKGCPIGFLAYKLNGLVLERTGIRIAGQGLSASLPEGTGAYIGLLKAALELGRGAYDFMEADAPLHHFLVIRTWQRLGFQLVRGKYAFHRELV
jgi:GNAT superfamily N-acetyltransferase